MTMIKQMLWVLQQATFQTMLALIASIALRFLSIMASASTTGNVLANSPQCWNNEIQLACQL